MNQQILELIAEVRRLTNQPRRATHIGFLLAMIYASLDRTGKQRFLECLEEIVREKK